MNKKKAGKYVGYIFVVIGLFLYVWNIIVLIGSVMLKTDTWGYTSFGIMEKFGLGMSFFYILFFVFFLSFLAYILIYKHYSFLKFFYFIIVCGILQIILLFLLGSVANSLQF